MVVFCLVSISGVPRFFTLLESYSGRNTSHLCHCAGARQSGRGEKGEDEQQWGENKVMLRAAEKNREATTHPNIKDEGGTSSYR